MLASGPKERLWGGFELVGGSTPAWPLARWSLTHFICQWFLCKNVFLPLKCHHLSHLWAGNSPISVVREYQNSPFSFSSYPPVLLELGWLGEGFENFVCAYPRLVLWGGGPWCACCAWSLPSHTSACPGCCWCGSLFGVEKQIFSNGQLRHSFGKLLYRVVIPPPWKISCLDCSLFRPFLLLLKTCELLWGVRWLALPAHQHLWKGTEDTFFFARLLEIFWAGRTEIIENPLIYDAHMPCCLSYRFYIIFGVYFYSDYIVFSLLLIVSVICLLNVLSSVILTNFTFELPIFLLKDWKLL